MEREESQEKGPRWSWARNKMGNITLEHTVINSSEAEAAARRFTEVMGLEVGGREGVDGKFIWVRVNDTLRLFFVTTEKMTSQHLAFVVDDASFDQIVNRLLQKGVRFGNSPRDTENGRTDHPFAPRGLFWTDPDGHLYEIMTHFRVL
jgi:catechol 2,3-dioxygenase-like lactoylglutathione lyase family enzyme